MYFLVLSSIDMSESLKTFWTTVANNILPIIIFLSIFIEIAPIKVNPLSWLMELICKPINEKNDAKFKEQEDRMTDRYEKLAKQIDDNNKETNDKIESIHTTQLAIKNQMAETEEKEDIRYMKSLRLDILEFANSIDNGQVHSREEYNHMEDIIKEYDDIITERNLTNGVIDEAVKKINEHYDENKDSTSYYF